MSARWGAALAAVLMVLGAQARAQQLPASATATDGAGLPFFTFAVQEDRLSGAPDQSGLNRPLDAAARVVARDGHLWTVGADGRPGTADDQRARLFGVNLSFATNFPSDADALRLARRLRRLGFNAARLHHMDTAPDTRDPPRSVLLPGPLPTFNPEALRRLRQFITVLAGEGIYVDLNLRVGYRFRPGVDGVPPLPDGQREAALTSPLYIYTPRMVALEEAYARGLIRGLQLKGQPGLALVEVSNEASLLAAWRRNEWRDAVPPAYAPELRRQWQQWVTRRHGSAAAACKAWGVCAQADGPIELLAPDSDDGTPPSLATTLRDKAARKLRGLARGWIGEAVAAPADTAPTEGRALRRADFLRFLAETDRRYFERLRQVVHEETDGLVPVTGTQMDYGGVLNFDASARMDWLDTHFYADHPDFVSNDWDPRNWRMRDLSLASAAELDKLLSATFWREASKPFVMSEFSQPFPNRQGGIATPLAAAVAAQQDWDGMFLFDYGDIDTWAEAPTSFTLSGDWGRYALVGAAAQLFRQPLVPALPPAPAVALPASARLAGALDSDRWAMLPMLAARAGLTPQVALQRRIGMDPAAPSWQPLQVPPSQPALRADRERGTVLLRTPAAAGFFGAVGAGRSLGDGTAQLLMGKAGRGYAAVVVTSLDGQPLPASRHLLVSVSGATRGSQPGSMPRRPKDIVAYQGQRGWWTLEADPMASDKPSGSRDAIGPVWLEQVPAELRLATTATQATVYPLDGAGRRQAALRADQAGVGGGQLRVALHAEPAQSTPWYEIVLP